MPTVAREPLELSMAYHQRRDDVVAALGVDPRPGLTDDEAESRLASGRVTFDGSGYAPGEERPLLTEERPP